jgi:hypothetical protein
MQLFDIRILSTYNGSKYQVFVRENKLVSFTKRTASIANTKLSIIIANVINAQISLYRKLQFWEKSRNTEAKNKISIAQDNRKNVWSIFRIGPCIPILSKMERNIIQIIGIKVTLTKIVIMVIGSMTHTSHLWTNINNH